MSTTPPHSEFLDLWPTLIMRNQLPAAEQVNNALEIEIIRLESEQPNITTDYLTENLLASTHPAVS